MFLAQSSSRFAKWAYRHTDCGKTNILKITMIAKHINSHCCLKKQTTGSTFISLFYALISTIDLHSIVGCGKEGLFLDLQSRVMLLLISKLLVHYFSVSNSLSIQNIPLSSQSRSGVVPWNIWEENKKQKSYQRTHQIFLHISQ